MLKAVIFDMEGSTPIPYVKELIQDLHQHGIQLAIASSSTMELIEEITERFELHPYFNKLISGTTVPQSKPSPDIFLKTCKELGVLPEEVMIIEDSSNGVLAATRANIPVIGFQNPHSGQQDLSKACLIVEGFEDIDYEFINRTYCHAHGLAATIATTERLIIRELSLEDIPKLYELYEDETFQAQGLSYATSLEEAMEKHKAYMKYVYHLLGFGLWGIFLATTNELIGHCGIELKDILLQQEEISIYELGYGIKKCFQNKGYAKEALHAILNFATEELYLKELCAVIAEDNYASIHLATSLGFRKEDVEFSRCDVKYNTDRNKQFSFYRLPLENALTNES